MKRVTTRPSMNTSDNKNMTESQEQSPSCVFDSCDRESNIAHGAYLTYPLTAAMSEALTIRSAG